MTVTKELVLATLCAMVGSAAIAVTITNGYGGYTVTGVVLICLAIFWANGGILGHGTL